MNNRKKFLEVIAENDIQTIQKFLDEKYRLQTEELHEAFVSLPQQCRIKQPNYSGISEQVIAMLVQYNAFPEGVLSGTVRYILKLLGNESIFFDTDYYEVNPEGCVGLPSPLYLLTLRSDLLGIKYLILNKGVSQRPINQLFLPPINSIGFAHHNRYCSSRESYHTSLRALYEARVLVQCEIAALFIRYPTDDLFSIINKEAQLKEEKEYNEIYNFSFKVIQYLPFFTWVMIFNQQDLFSASAFIKLIEGFPTAAFESIKIAAALEYNEYIKNIIQFVNPLSTGGKILLEKLEIDVGKDISLQIQHLLKKYQLLQKNEKLIQSEAGVLLSQDESDKSHVNDDMSWDRMVEELMGPNDKNSNLEFSYHQAEEILTRGMHEVEINFGNKDDAFKQIMEKAQLNFTLFKSKPENLLQSSNNNFPTSKTPYIKF